MIKRMPTDTNRVRRNDPGDPDKCPVWQFHQVYTDDTTKQWVQEGCRSAGIGCLDCKGPVIEAVVSELKPMQARAAEFETQPELVREIIREGSERARAVALETMLEVRQSMSLDLA
jgi:tryptophanyl-tRNA synthetase